MMPTNQPQPAQQGGQPSPAEAKQMLTQIITEARKMAQQYGVDFDSIVNSTGGGNPSSPPPPPASMM